MHRGLLKFIGGRGWPPCSRLRPWFERRHLFCIVQRPPVVPLIRPNSFLFQRRRDDNLLSIFTLLIGTHWPRHPEGAGGAEATRWSALITPRAAPAARVTRRVPDAVSTRRSLNGARDETYGVSGLNPGLQGSGCLLTRKM